ncbi:MAG: hypothetical protein ACLR6O_02880 [Eubacterium sp.]
MDNPVKVTETSITTQKEQTLYLGHEDGDLLDGKFLLSMMLFRTGESLKAVQSVKAFNGNIKNDCALLQRRQCRA